MEVLPLDVVSEILSLVPDEFILNCKLVCKTWETLLLGRKVGKAGLLFTLSSGANRKAIYYGDYEEILGLENGGESCCSFKSLTKKVNHPPFNPGHKCKSIMVGSCNGLVCISRPHHGIYDPVYICNPYTGEYVNLPRLKVVPRPQVVVGGFGYLPATNEYKVIRVFYTSFRGVGYVQIYTLGSDSGWRSIGEIKHQLWFPGVVADGTIYFMDNDMSEILAFHLAEEEFQVLPSPECMSTNEGRKDVNFQIKVMKGCLCVAHQPENVPHQLASGSSVDIWSFKNNEKDNCSTGKKDYTSWRWHREYSVPWFSDHDDFDFYEPFAVTKSNKVLLWVIAWVGMILYCFNPETGSATWILDSDSKDFEHFQAIPHVNTLVSLKSLGVRSKRGRLAGYDRSQPYATQASKLRTDDKQRHGLTEVMDIKVNGMDSSDGYQVNGYNCLEINRAMMSCSLETALTMVS